MKLFQLSVFSFLLCLCSCSTFQHDSQVAETGIDTSVTVAMTVWNVYLAEGGAASDDQKARVAKAFVVYQKAKTVFDDFMIGYKAHPDDSQLEMALTALNYSAVAIGELLMEFLPKDRLPLVPARRTFYVNTVQAAKWPKAKQ